MPPTRSAWSHPCSTDGILAVGFQHSTVKEVCAIEYTHTWWDGFSLSRVRKEAQSMPPYMALLPRNKCNNRLREKYMYMMSLSTSSRSTRLQQTPWILRAAPCLARVVKKSKPRSVAAAGQFNTTHLSPWSNHIAVVMAKSLPLLGTSVGWHQRVVSETYLSLLRL